MSIHRVRDGNQRATARKSIQTRAFPTLLLFKGRTSNAKQLASSHKARDDGIQRGAGVVVRPHYLALAGIACKHRPIWDDTAAEALL